MKSLFLVKYNEILFSIEKEIIFLSFIEPFGWATILQPFLFSNFILSVNGKKPSEAQTNDLVLKYLFMFFIAELSASNLFV